jgi:hypothetical protein
MKIKKQISAFFSLALAVVFLLSGSGFNVYLHQCDSNHTEELSFFVKEFSCDHEKNNHEVHEHESGTGCCSSIIEAFDNEGANCCHTSSIYYKISNEFEKRSTTSPSNLHLIICHIYNTLDTDSVFTEEQNFVNNSLSPPPIYGFDRTISLHKLKIACIA